ncbi:peptidase S9 prolyl oligopeptidase active site domain protein, partial [mine drainage metagenome]
SDKSRTENADIDKVPISARAAAASLSLGPPRLSPDGTKVCYSSSSSSGNALFVSPVQSPLERLATPFSVKSGYFGFGGYYSFSMDGSSVFVVESTGDLKLVDLASGSSCTIYSGGAVSDLEPSPDGSKIAFVVGQASILVADIDGDDIEVSLVADLSHARSGYKSPDFFASPKFSPDGIYLVWSEWSFPDMAWDASRMVMVRAAGPKYPPQLVVGSPNGAFSVTQPKFSPSGSDLYFISDQSGFSIPWRMSLSTGVSQPVF